MIDTNTTPRIFPSPSLTRHQAAIIGAYTGILCGPFEDLHQYVEQVMGRPVWTHEMGDRETMERIKELAKTDFLMLLPKGTNMPKEKP